MLILSFYSWTNCSPQGRVYYKIAIHKTMAFLLCCDENCSPCWWPQESRLFRACNFSSLKFQRSFLNIYHKKPTFSALTLCSSVTEFYMLMKPCREGNANMLGLESSRLWKNVKKVKRNLAEIQQYIEEIGQD